MEKKTGSTAGRNQLTLISFWIISVCLVAMAWSYPSWAVYTGLRPVLALLLLFVNYAVLSVTLIKGFESPSRGNAHVYRLAFIISATLVVIQVIFNSVYPNAFAANGQDYSRYWSDSILESIALIGFLSLGSFSGAFLYTASAEGLMEVNTPPAQVITDVYQRHLATIGVLGAEPKDKRLFDIILALMGLVLSTPIWITCTFLLWLEDPGPVLYVKNSTGKEGVNFRLLKFRSMTLQEEKRMGLVQTQEVETKTLLVGRFLRKTALDELPQLINILRNEMSFVGPRPHRTTLVELYLTQMPEFAERHQVLPGLSGLAQVSGDFYMTARQKLRLDRLYIQHRSLGFDIKLLFLAFPITFWYRWRRGWDGRLPRRLLHKKR